MPDHSPADVEQDIASFFDWVPFRLWWQGSAATLDWCYLGDRRFVRPFFEDTIGECLSNRLDAPTLRRSSPDLLSTLALARPSVPPTAFIFHMSRCGSTLVSQLLATLPSAIVISEAELIDAVLRSRPPGRPVSPGQRETWLRWTIMTLGWRRHQQERHLFVKFDAWSILNLPLIRRVFPTVPWLFVYRDPLEVLVSHRRQPGRHVVPGVLDLDITVDGQAGDGRARLDAYAATVLERICAAAAEAYRPGEAWLLNYRDLPDAVWTSLPDVLGIALSAGDVERMRHAARWNAKQPHDLFQADASAKRASAPDDVRRTAATLAPVYARLEALRARQGVTGRG